ncbi:hypothetical protein MRX96_034205 [Rhipicephalus microplus]
MIKTLKNLLTKAKDPVMALLCSRNTPGGKCFSPAQLLMGRRLRAKVFKSGLLLAYALRFSLSVALVAMVNQTANAHDLGPVFAIQPTSATTISAAAAEPMDAPPANDTGTATDVPVITTTAAPYFSRDGGYGQCLAPVPPQDSHKLSSEGEFPWSPWTQGVVLGAFFYGYAATQMPGGWLAGRVGGKWPFGLGLLGTALGSLVTPAAARAHSSFSHDAGAAALVAVRVLEGLGEGVTYPAMFSMVAEWAPPHERGSLLAVAYVGSQRRCHLGHARDGHVVRHHRMGGRLLRLRRNCLKVLILWHKKLRSPKDATCPSCCLRRIVGLVGCAYFVLYSWRVRSTPEEDPWISDAEYDYIALGRTARPLPPLQAKALEAGSSDLLNAKECSKHGTPWFQLLTSAPCVGADRISSGMINAAMFAAQSVGMLGGGLLSDRLRRKGHLSTTFIRKLFQTAALTGAGLLLALVPSAGCNQLTVTCLLVLALGVYGLAAGGATPALVDMAPAHAGILYGIAGTVSNASGFLAPMVVGMVTSPMPTLDNWATVFYLTSGIFLLGALAFLVFGSAELQPWAKPPPPLETVATHIEHQHADGAHRFDLTTSFAESFHMF